MKKQEHIVCISSTRPELLVKQITSFIENASEYDMFKKIRIKFVIVDDTIDKQSLFEDALKQVQSQHKYYIGTTKVVEVIYWPLKKQVTFLGQLRASLLDHGQSSAAKSVDFFFRDLGMSKFGGIRGVQNKADILGRLESSSDNSVLHKIDDDVYALSLEVLDQEVRIHYAYNFFGSRYQGLQREEVSLIGSTYSGDSPSHIADLYDGVKIMNNFFKLSKEVSDPSSNWSGIAKEVTPSAVNILTDPLNLIDTPILKLDVSYAETLKVLSQLFDLLFKGNCRLIFSDANYFKSADWFGLRDFVPGGCVSYLTKNLDIPPTFPVANQDILTTYYLSASKQSVLGELDILHLKNFSTRDGIFDDLESSKKHDFKATFYLYKLITEDFDYSSNFQGHRSLGDDFFHNGSLMVQDLLRFNEELLTMFSMSESRYWWQGSDYIKEISNIKKKCQHIKDYKNLLLENFSFEREVPEEYIQIYQSYKSNLVNWELIRNEALKRP